MQNFNSLRIDLNIGVSETHRYRNFYEQAPAPLSNVEALRHAEE